MSPREDDGAAVAMIGLLMVGCAVVVLWLVVLFFGD
jgi:hypothetical protein